jgi:hypothetical protein
MLYGVLLNFGAGVRMPMEKLKDACTKLKRKANAQDVTSYYELISDGKSHPHTCRGSTACVVECMSLAYHFVRKATTNLKARRSGRARVMKGDTTVHT